MREIYEDSLTRLRKLGDKETIADTRNYLGEISRVEGDYNTVGKFYEESLGIRQELGYERGMAISLINLGLVAHYQESLTAGILDGFQPLFTYSSPPPTFAPYVRRWINPCWS